MKLEQFNKKPSLFESMGLRDPYFETWEREIHPGLVRLAMLNEGVALTPDQIDQIFGAAQAGGGRSMLGKAADAVKGAKDKISDVWFNKFGGMLQNSEPVKNFDAKYEEIKGKIAAKYPDLAEKLAKYGEFAKNNPKTHKFLLAIAGSVAAAAGVAVAGGVGAGALAVGTGAGIATGIINIADRLLQGQKASTAIGRGATAGAVAGLAAGLAATVANMVQAGFKADYIGTLGDNQIMKGTFSYNGDYTFITGRPEDVQAASKAFNQENWQAFYDIVNKVRDPEYLKALDASREVVKQAAEHYKETTEVIQGLSQIASSAVAGGTAAAGTQPAPTTAESRQAYKAKIIVEFLDKISSKNLRKKWEAAGSPTDSDAVAKVMIDAGANPEVVKNAFTTVGVEPPATLTTAPAADPATGNAAPGTDTTGNAAPASAEPVVANQSSGQITDWKTLRDKFEAFQDADGAMVPQVRGVLRDILLQAFAVVENKKHKWYAFKQLLEADLRREKKLLEAKKK
jgi:hypothetical protein